MPTLLVKNLSVSSMGEGLLKGVSFTFSGNAFCICGKKHAGKTPLCLALAGFGNPEGEMELNGEDITRVSPERRNVGVLFGKAKLFRGSVGKNIAYGLTLRKEENATEQALQTAKALGLAEIFDKKAKKFKGVQAQKIAFARLIARHPTAIFADFPVREDGEEELAFLRECLAVCKARGILFVLFTESAVQANLFSTLGVLEKGELTFFGSREELLFSPPTLISATFGAENVNVLYAEKKNGFLTVGNAELFPLEGEGEARVLVYEDFALLSPTGIPCRVDYVEKVGKKYRYYLDFSLKDEEIGGRVTRFTLLSAVMPNEGATTVYLTVNPKKVFVF